jgi:intracellular sulfur oxidation DsrE/DsrF family protein
MTQHDVSDEKLQAFLDGQLDAAEKSEIFAAIKRDDALKREACEIRTLTELVRHAYSGATPTEQTTVPRGRHALALSRWGVAASVALLLGLGGVLGWVGHTPDMPAGFGIQAMYWDEDRAFQNEDLNAITSRQGAKRIIVHLNTSSLDKFEKALSTAERLLQTYSDVDRGTEIEVVANASAIKMLRAGVSPYADRVRDLQQRYINLTFLACKDAMDHIQELEGPDSKVRLLPDVDVTPSALEHILERLSDGWVYINV